MKSVIEYVIDFPETATFSGRDRERVVQEARVFLETQARHRKLTMTYFVRAWFYETKTAKVSGIRRTQYVRKWRSPSLSFERETVKRLLYELEIIEVMP